MHVGKKHKAIDGKKTIRETVRHFLLQVPLLYMFIFFICFYPYHDFISVTCPMCRRPIYEEDRDGEETAPPSSFNLPWIISKLPSGFGSGFGFGFGSRSREDSTSRLEQSIKRTFRNISRFFRFRERRPTFDCLSGSHHQRLENGCC